MQGNTMKEVSVKEPASKNTEKGGYRWEPGLES